MKLDRDGVVEKYSKVNLEFDRYYKYGFFYSGCTSEGHIIKVKYGGISDQIYRFEFTGGDEVFGCPELWDYVTIETEKGEVLYEYIDELYY